MRPACAEQAVGFGEIGQRATFQWGELPADQGAVRLSQFVHPSLRVQQVAQKIWTIAQAEEVAQDENPTPSSLSK